MLALHIDVKAVWKKNAVIFCSISWNYVQELLESKNIGAEAPVLKQIQFFQNLYQTSV